MVRAASGRIVLLLILASATIAASAAPDAPEAGGWRERFDAIYRLDKGQAAAFVPAPFPPERELYYRNGPMRGSNPALARSGQFTLHWTDGAGVKFHSYSAGGGTVTSALAACGLASWEMERGPGFAQNRLPPLEGDWIIRADAPLEQKLTAVQNIIQQRTRRPIQLHKRLVEREVIVAQGRLEVRPLPGEANDKGIYVVGAERVGENGGGSGTLARFFDSLADMTRRPVVDETESSQQKVRWTWDLSASAASEDAAKLGPLLANLSRQTGLRLRTEKRRVAVYFLVDGQASAA